MALVRLGCDRRSAGTSDTVVMPVVRGASTLVTTTQPILQPDLDMSTCSTLPVLQRSSAGHQGSASSTQRVRGPSEDGPVASRQQTFRHGGNIKTNTWVFLPDASRTLAPVKMREQMMGFSGQHTARMTSDPTEYHRNKALGNTWHVPTATCFCSSC